MGDVRAGWSLSIAARNVGPYGIPECPRGREVSSEGVPLQSRAIRPQRGESRTGKPASLVRRICRGLLNPAAPAPRADLVVDGEDLDTVQMRGALAPADSVGRRRVLPSGAVQLRGPCRTGGAPSPPELPRRWFSSRNGCLSGELSCRLPVFVAGHPAIVPAGSVTHRSLDRKSGRCGVRAYPRSDGRRRRQDPYGALPGTTRSVGRSEISRTRRGSGDEPVARRPGGTALAALGAYAVPHRPG